MPEEDQNSEEDSVDAPKVEDVTEDEEIGVQEVQDEVQKAASTHVEEEGTSGADFDINEDVDSFASKVDGVLQDAGLTKKHVYFCCGGVSFLAIVILIVFVGVKFFVTFLDGGIKPGGDGDVPDFVDPVEEDVPQGVVWVDSSLYGGILIGTDSGLIGKSGVEQGMDVGEVDTVSDDDLAYGIEHYGKVMNALSFDVNDYLNDFSDRSSAVDDLIIELQSLYDEGVELLKDLQNETDELEVLYNGNSSGKDLKEAEFFAEFEDYDGDDAVSALNDFVKIGQDQVDLKAQYKARGKLYEVLYSALLYLNARIEDVTLNKEALVKGVQVVDVRGSDLDLIFEEGLE